MASLFDQQIDQTYQGLFKTSDNGPVLTEGRKQLSDGEGNLLPIEVSQAEVLLVNPILYTGSGQTAIITDNNTDSFIYLGNQDFSAATVTGLPDTDTTYTISSAQDGLNADIKLVDQLGNTSKVTLVAGTNITLSNSGNDLTINAAGGGGAAGLVAGTGVNSMKNSDALVTTPATATSVDDIVLGNGAYDNTASAVNGKNVIIGSGAGMSGGEWNVVIGKNAISAKGSSIVIGNGAQNNSGSAICIGSGAYTDSLDEQLVIGLNAKGYGNAGCISLGRDAINYGANTIAIGRNAVAGGSPGDPTTAGVAIGNNATAAGNKSIALGIDTNTVYDDAIAIGNGAKSTFFRTIAIGKNSQVNGVASIAIGENSKTTGYNQIAIGQDAQITNGGAEQSMALGYFAKITTGVIGATALGAGVTAGTANTVTLKKLQMLDYATLNYASDAAAATGGIPLGGVYHTEGALKIRIV